MYARGLTVREIQGYLAEAYGTEVGHDLISTVTDGVLAEVTAWQARPLEPVYPVAFRKKIYRTIEELQTNLDSWVADYNQNRPHQGRWCFGKTPMQIFLDTIPLAKEKLMAA